MKKNRNYLIRNTRIDSVYDIRRNPGILCYFPVFYRLVGLGEINFVGIKNFVTLFTDSRFAPYVFNAIKTILNT